MARDKLEQMACGLEQIGAASGVAMTEHRRASGGKRALVVAALRERIVAGALAPGERLTSRALQAEFGAGAAVVQAAVDELLADGFLTTRDRAGTFVADRPPHLFRYGVVLLEPSPLTAPPDGTFESVLARACAAPRGGLDGRTLVLYTGIQGHVDDLDGQRLADDVAARRLAGLLYSTCSSYLAVQHLHDGGLPALVVGTSTDAAPCIALDHHSFVDQALDRFVAQGRRRLAVVRASDAPEHVAYLRAAAVQRGLTWQPAWDLECIARPLPIVRTASHLLMRVAGERPDAVLIWDDIFVEPVVAGLLDAGVRLGVDVEVIAHCNYPLVRGDQAPIARLGFDVPRLLELGLELIARAPLANGVREVWPARFAEELGR